MRLFRNPLFCLSLVLALALGTQIANLAEAAFTEPTVPFPGGAPAAPLDTSGNSQIKSGSLEIDGFLSVGTAPAGHAFDVSGTLGVTGLSDIGSLVVGTYAGVNAPPAGGAIFSGKVGLGTTTPQTSLHVSGSFPQLRLDGPGSAPGLEFYSASTYYGDISAGASAALGVRNNAGTNVFLIKQNGYVGIGTNSPGAKLEVVGMVSSTNIYALAAESRFAAGGAYADPNSGVLYAIKVGAGGIAVNGNSLFNNNLQVLGTASSTQVVTTQICFPDNTPANCKNAWPTAASISGVGSGKTSFLPLWSSDSVLATSTLYQDSNKNIGIGTTTPGTTLDVNGYLNTKYLYVSDGSNGVVASRNGNLFLSSNGTSPVTINQAGNYAYPGQTGGQGGTGGLAIYSGGTSNVQQAQIGGAGNTWFNSGSVGIGTTQPVYTLQIAGALGVEGTPVDPGSSAVVLGSGKSSTYGAFNICGYTGYPSCQPDTFDNNTSIPDFTAGSTNPTPGTCSASQGSITGTTYNDVGKSYVPGTTNTVSVQRTVICVNPATPLYKISNYSGTLQFSNNSGLQELTLDQSGVLNVGGGNFKVDALGTSTVAGNFKVGGTLGVTGVASFSGNVGIKTTGSPQADLDVNGWTRTSGLRANTGLFDGNVSIGTSTQIGTLTVAGVLEMVPNSNGYSYLEIKGSSASISLESNNLGDSFLNFTDPNAPSGPTPAPHIWYSPTSNYNYLQIYSPSRIQLITFGNEILANSTGFRLASNGTKPTCDSSSAGTLWFARGGGSNSDILSICMYDGNLSSYNWRAL